VPDDANQVAEALEMSSGIVRTPAVGSTFGISVSAPGIGKTIYRVINVNEDWSIEVEMVRSTVRDLEVSDVI
jgi:hypothetical protein